MVALFKKNQREDFLFVQRIIVSTIVRISLLRICVRIVLKGNTADCC